MVFSLSNARLQSLDSRLKQRFRPRGQCLLLLSCFEFPLQCRQDVLAPHPRRRRHDSLQKPEMKVPRRNADESIEVPQTLRVHSEPDVPAVHLRYVLELVRPIKVRKTLVSDLVADFQDGRLAYGDTFLARFQENRMNRLHLVFADLRPQLRWKVEEAEWLLFFAFLLRNVSASSHTR